MKADGKTTESSKAVQTDEIKLEMLSLSEFVEKYGPIKIGIRDINAANEQ